MLLWRTLRSDDDVIDVCQGVVIDVCEGVVIGWCIITVCEGIFIMY